MSAIRVLLGLKFHTQSHCVCARGGIGEKPPPPAHAPFLEELQLNPIRQRDEIGAEGRRVVSTEDPQALASILLSSATWWGGQPNDVRATPLRSHDLAWSTRRAG